MSTQYTPLEDIPKVCLPAGKRFRIMMSSWCLQIHATAYRAFNADKAKSIAFRKKQIAQVAYILKDNEDRWKEALRLDLGRHPLEVELCVSIHVEKT